MDVQIWDNEDKVIDTISRAYEKQLIRQSNLELLKELHYIHEMQGKEAMLTKLEFLMNDYKLPYIKLTP